MDSLLLFEILHSGSFRLNNDKIYTGANLIALGIENITCSIVANILLKCRIHPYLFDTSQESNGIIDMRDKYLAVKIT